MFAKLPLNTLKTVYAKLTQPLRHTLLIILLSRFRKIRNIIYKLFHVSEAHLFNFPSNTQTL